MESNELKTATSTGVKYTLGNLLNDILDSSDENCSEVEKTDKTAREHRAKKVVIQMLIEQANAFGVDAYKNGKKLRGISRNKICVVSGLDSSHNSFFFITDVSKLNEMTFESKRLLVESLQQTSEKFIPYYNNANSWILLYEPNDISHVSQQHLYT